MLPAIVIILFFIAILIATFGMFAAYASEEHSKRDLSKWISFLWFVVVIAGVFCCTQVVDVVNASSNFTGY